MSTQCHPIVLLIALGAVGVAAKADLIAYYPFEGDAQDASGNGVHGTVFGAVPTDDGFRGAAFEFDGLNDYVFLPLDMNPNALPQLTMGAWVNTDSQDEDPHMVISHDNGGFDRSIGFDDRGGAGFPQEWMTFTGDAGEGVFASGVDVVVGTWVFLAVVYDQDTEMARLYVDDQEFSTPTGFGAGNSFTRIGSNPDFGEFFDGRIDEVFFFDEILSKAEIADIRKNGVPAPSSLVLLSLGLMGLSQRRRIPA